MSLILDGTNGLSDVDGSASTPAIRGTDTNTGIFFPAADTIAFSEGGAEVARIDSAGNVGIGTTSPTTYGASTKLAVVSTSTAATWLVGGTSGGAYAYYSNNAQSSSANTMQIGQGWATGSDNIGFLNTNGANPLLFATNGAERMRIISGGDVYVGATSTIGANERFGVYRSDNGTAAIFVSTSTGQSGDIIQVRANRNTTNGTFRPINYYNDAAGAYRFNVLDSGNCQNTNGSYGAISDIKLKENIIDATPKLEDLCKVKVRNYNLKSDQTHKQIGVIAQELEEVFAGLVEEIADKDIDGNDLGTTTKTVKYSVFVPMLIKAIQELKAELDTVKAELATLKA